MVSENFVCKCIADSIDGLCDGLSHFSGPSRAAIVYMTESEDPVRIYDPQSLLRGHEPILEELYLKSNDWLRSVSIPNEKKKFSDMLPEKNLQLAGIISYGGRSSSVFYQMWFTEHHPDICAVGPTERWLEHAAWRLSHDIANEEDLYTGISGSFLREYSTHAVRDYIIDEMNVLLGWDTQIRVYPILDAALEISRTREEGAWPHGELIFAEPWAFPQIEFMARFPEMEQPSVEHFKHVRKLLLAVEHSDRKLVCDGKTIVGVARGTTPAFCIIAEFRGRHGFLKLNEQKICSFSGGSFKSSTRQAKLVQVEEILLESTLNPRARHSLFKAIGSLVRNAETQKHGCTIVIDFNEQPEKISGQQLAQALDLKQPKNLELAKSLSKVDGALHVGAGLNLYAFACLLDGRSIPGEDRARGARFNSALRFTSEHRDVIVVVVSSDRPVAVIQEGVEVSAQCQWKPTASCMPLPIKLDEWIATSGE